MARLGYMLTCFVLMGLFMWGLHEIIYRTSADFSLGFTLGGVSMALIFGAYLKLRFNE